MSSLFPLIAAAAAILGALLTARILAKSSQSAKTPDQPKDLLLEKRDVEKWNAFRTLNPDWAPSLSEENFEKFDLSGVDLRLADLSGAVFVDAKLEEADFRGANLSGARFLRADLTRASLEDANLKEANFESAILAGTILAKKREQVARSAAPESVEILSAPEPPRDLIDAVDALNVGLLKYLQRHPEDVYSLSPRMFEKLVAEMLANFGWQIEFTPQTKDGGYDIFAVSRDASGARTSWIIECKKYSKHRKVGVDIVRALYAVKLSERAANVMLVTTSNFTRGVEDFKTHAHDLELKDYGDLVEWLRSYKPRPDGALYLEGPPKVLEVSGYDRTEQGIGAVQEDPSNAGDEAEG